MRSFGIVRYPRMGKRFLWDLEVLCDWLNVRDIKEHGSSVSHGPVACELWHTPPLMFYKCNVDVAFFYDSGTFGLGKGLRNEEGEVLACGLNLLQDLPTVREGEAMALLDVITWAKEVELVNIIFESYAKVRGGGRYSCW